MDPDAVLGQLRDLTREGHFHAPPEEAKEIAELFRSLDEWLSNGGFLPEPWTVRAWLNSLSKEKN